MCFQIHTVYTKIDPTPNDKGGIFCKNGDDLKESRSWHEKFRCRQREGQRNQQRKWAIACSEVSTEGFWTATPPIAHAGRSFDVLRRKIGGVALGAKSCKNPRSKTELSDCPRIMSQILAEMHTSSGRRRRNRWCLGCVIQRLLSLGSPASPGFPASCCSDGSLAVIRPLWFQITSEVSSMLERMATAHAGAFPSSSAGCCLGKHRCATDPSQPTSHCSFHFHLIGDLHASIIGLGIEEKKDLVPPLMPLLPCWSAVIAAFETGVSTKTGVRGGLVHMDQRWFQWVTKLLLLLKYGNPEERIWNFDYAAAAKMLKTATDSAA